MKKSEYSFLVDYADDILKDHDKAEKRKKTKQRKRIEEHIAVAIMQNRPKRAIDLCEMYNIPPQDFAKMVVKYSPFKISKEECDINKKLENGEFVEV